MKRLLRYALLLFIALPFTPASLPAATFNIVDYGATPNDDVDDTVAVEVAEIDPHR